MKFLLIGCLLVTFLSLVSTQPTSKEFKRPPTQNGPVVISIGIYVLGLHEINEKEMDYTLTMYYRESWMDSRISPNNASIIVNRYDFKKFWFPDIYIKNEKSSSTHNVMTENRLLKINPDGKLWHVKRISTTLSCPMNFIRYPFDTQVCPMVFESFGYMTNTLVLTWMDHPVELYESTDFPYFLVDSLHEDCSHTSSIGGFPCLEIRFIFKRDLTSSIIDFFLPTTFLVVVAWMTFWIDLRSTTHRIVVCSIALFFVGVKHGRMRKNLPSLNHLTAADVWTIICCAHILHTITVHIIVNIMLNVTHKPHKLESNIEKVTLENPDKPQKKEKIIFSGLKNIILGEWPLRVKDVDKCKHNMQLLNALSRVIAALLFLFVLTAYFCFYTSVVLKY